MSDFAPSIRPHPDKLRSLATLATQSPLKGLVWELKLVTHDIKYWLCTQTSSGEAGSFVSGRVVAESVTPNPATGRHDMLEYGPDDVSELQGIDYIRGLTDQIQALEQHQQHDYTHARAQELDDARRDLHLALVALGLKAPIA